MKLNLRLSTNGKLTVLKYLVAALLVMIIGSIIILSQGNSPAEAFKALGVGAFGSVSAIGTTIRWATPSIITGISAVIAFKSGIWNVARSSRRSSATSCSCPAGYISSSACWWRGSAA